MIHAGCLIEQPEPVTASLLAPTIAPSKILENSPTEELHTFAYMKGGRASEGDSFSPSSFYSLGEGQGRGETSFPQPSLDPLAIADEDLSEVIAEIQVQFRRMAWDAHQVVQFIADNFGGKRRSQLTDDELLGLLYRLRTRSLSD